jgi:choline kinase
MKCVVLAAGSSTRLRPLTQDLPKCLLSVGGKTILQRTLDTLLAADITDIALVLGFQAAKIREYVRKDFPGRKIRFILNPNFASTNNAYSLLLARQYALGTKDRENSRHNLLILDSDIVFHPGILDLMKNQPAENRIAVRTQGAHDPEEVTVSIDGDGFLTRIGKESSLRSVAGESIGIEWFSHEAATLLFGVLQQRIREGRGRTEFYESAFQELVDTGVKIKTVDASTYPAIEIDSHADLEQAESTIIPLIERD